MKTPEHFYITLTFSKENKTIFSKRCEWMTGLTKNSYNNDIIRINRFIDKIKQEIINNYEKY